MKVYCISGKAGHGKDTLACVMRNLFTHEGQRVLVTHYADVLKWLCASFFGWNGVKDEGGRALLQHVGTDIIRKQRPDFWVSFIADILSLLHDSWDIVIIPDCRFPNEIEYLVDKGFDVTHIRIVRTNFASTLTVEAQAHPSETALDGYPSDVTVVNDGTIDDLYDRVRDIDQNRKENDFGFQD